MRDDGFGAGIDDDGDGARRKSGELKNQLDSSEEDTTSSFCVSIV